MADTSNGLMYGTAEVKFKESGSASQEKTLGWLDENGVQAAGNAPQFIGVGAPIRNSLILQCPILLRFRYKLYFCRKKKYGKQ